jgi:hypothetical protein
VDAAQRSGWHEATAMTKLVLGLCLEARGEPDSALHVLSTAAQISDRYGIPAPGWEAHSALAQVLRVAGRPPEANEHSARAAAIVDRMAAGLIDGTLRERLIERAKP